MIKFVWFNGSMVYWHYSALVHWCRHLCGVELSLGEEGVAEGGHGAGVQVRVGQRVGQDHRQVRPPVSPPGVVHGAWWNDGIVFSLVPGAW